MALLSRKAIEQALAEAFATVKISGGREVRVAHLPPGRRIETMFAVKELCDSPDGEIDVEALKTDGTKLEKMMTLAQETAVRCCVGEDGKPLLSQIEETRIFEIEDLVDILMAACDLDAADDAAADAEKKSG